MKKLVALGCSLALTGSAFAGEALINGITYGSPVALIPYAGPEVIGNAIDPNVVSQGGNIFVAPTANGTLDIELNIGRTKGSFDLTGAGGSANNVASVPHNTTDGGGPGYVFEAGWVVGEKTIPAYDTGESTYRCYVGMYPDNANFPGDQTTAYGVLGIEYQSGSDDFEVRSDNNGAWGDQGGSFVSVGTPSYFQVRVSRDAAGAVNGQYAADFGAYQNITGPFPNPLNLFAFALGALDGTGDTPGWSWRGDVSPSFSASLSTSDGAIPDTGVGIDTDGDGVDDENDPWPNNGDYSVDSDSDGLADEWEQDHFGDLSEDGSGNPDNDAYNNLTEFINGTDPNAGVPIVPSGAPAAGLLGLLALGGALTIVAAKKTRK